MIRPGQHVARIRMVLALYWPGWTWFMGLLFSLTGAALVLLAVPAWQKQIRQGEHALLQRQQERELRSALPAVPMQPVASREQKQLQAFYALLGQTRHVEQQLRTIFALAEKHHIAFRQADYKTSHHKEGRYATLQIDLPVQATYPAICRFVEDVLLAIPFASLDEIALRRDTPASTVLEATLRFTVFLESDETELISTPVATEGGAP